MATQSENRNLNQMWHKDKMHPLLHTSERNIPNDILIEILLRLSAKSLLRLRWACKYWFDLITRDDDFIKMHLHRSNTTTHDDNLFSITSPATVLSVNHRYASDQIFQCYLNYNNVSSAVSIAVPNGYPLDKDDILGSCNGLILLSQQRPVRNLCIWNPCTKEYKILPRPHPMSIYGSRNERYVEHYGFGYDQTIDNYKVIIRTTHSLWKCIIHSYDQVYTLGTHSWRRIKTNLCGLHPRKGVFVNGALYWMDSLRKNIISFDIGKETFQHVSKIPNFSDHGYYLSILACERSLCVAYKLIDQQMYRYCREIWVMKDYAVNNNNNNECLWTKLSTIPSYNCYSISMKLLRFTKDGKILMVNDQQEFVLHDPESCKVKTLNRISMDYTIKEVYIETLVSLNSGTYTSRVKNEEKNKQRTTTTRKS